MGRGGARTCVLVALRRRRDADRLVAVIDNLDAIVAGNRHVWVLRLEQGILPRGRPVRVESEQDTERRTDRDGHEDKVEDEQTPHGERTVSCVSIATGLVVVVAVVVVDCRLGVPRR